MTSMTSSSQQTRMTVFVATLSLVVLTGLGAGQAQTTDITSSGLNTQISAPTPLPNGMINFDITGGTRPGNGPNLFHSFGEFSVDSNNIANFLNETGLPTSNILSRVTGGNPSNIFGTLQTTNFSTANLYLINPAGVLFGPTAELNVGGSVNISTADYLKMTDGAKFHADLAQSTVLSMAPVSSFGFLGPNPGGTITIQGGTVKNTSVLTLVGWDKVNGTMVTPGIEVTGTLSNIGGQVTLVSVGSPTNVDTGEITVADQTPTGFDSLGTIALKPGASIDTSTDTSLNNPMAAGAIVIRGNRLEMDGASLRAISRGYNILPDVGALDPIVNVTAGDLAITVNTLNMHNSTIQTGSAPFAEDAGLRGGIGTVLKFDPTGGDITGRAVLSPGTIRLAVQDFSAQDSTISTSSSLMDGQPGLVVSIKGIGGSDAEASSVSLVNTSLGLNLGQNSLESLRAGDVEILAKDVTLDGLDHSALSPEGIGGNFVIHSSSNITIKNSQFGSISFFGSGGGILFEAGNKIDLASASLISAANSGLGAGNISLTAPVINMTGGEIRTDSTGLRAGNISFHVDALTVQAFNDGTTVTPAVISSSHLETAFVDAPFRAGQIKVEGLSGPGSSATSLSLDHSTISTSIFSGISSSVPADITIAAQAVNLANESQIHAFTAGLAPAGNITLNVDTLTVGGSEIVTSSFTSLLPDSTVGNAGSITIQGITGSGSPAAHVSLESSSISTLITGGSAANTNTPGAITITAQTLALANGGGIGADTFFGAAPAGNITLNVDTLTAGFFSEITSRSLFFESRTGNAGSITIQGITGSGSLAANVSLDNITISTTIGGGTSSSIPADIKVAAHAITLSNGSAMTASTTGNGPAGNIGLVTQRLNLSSESSITSNAVATLIPSPILGEPDIVSSGKAGSITITGAGSAPTTIADGTIQAQSETSATAGNITLQAPGDFTLLGATVSVKNTGPGSAGSINLRAGNDLLVRTSQLSTESAEASGGNIKLTAPDLVRIVDSTLTSSVQGQAGSNGGNINIDPQLVVIQNSQILANANAGAGGNISIAATGAVLVDPNSRIDASAGPAGVSGSVNINAPIQVLSGALVPLNLVYSQAGLSGDRCAADPQGQFSSFVQTGRDGVPQVPGALSPSPLSFLDPVTFGSLESPWPSLAAARLGLHSVSFDHSTLFRFHSACRS